MAILSAWVGSGIALDVMMYFSLRAGFFILTFCIFSSSAKAQLTPISENAHAEGLIFHQDLLTASDAGMEILEDLFSDSTTDSYSIFILGDPDKINGALKDLIPNALTAQQKHKINIVNWTDQNPWIRDWGPTFVRNGDQILPIDFEYRKGSKEDEFIQFFSSLGFISPSKKIDLKLATGNLQIDDLGNCFLSRTVLKDDSYESKVRDQLINEIGCVKVILLPRITFEATGHLDMWMKYLSKNRFIVSEVTTETIEAQTLMDKSLIPPLLDAKKDLDKSAKILADLGYSVLRVPILPFNFTSGDKGGRPVFRSYANSLILNKTLYVPSFVHFYHLNWGPELNSKLGWIEKSAFEVLKQLDFRIKAIDADDLVVEAGAIHCSFLQMPNGALLRPSNTKPQVRP